MMMKARMVAIMFALALAPTAVRPASPAPVQGSSASSSAPATVRLPQGDVPFSRHASPQAEAAFIRLLAQRQADAGTHRDLAAQRAAEDARDQKLVARMLATYPVKISRSIINGVPVETITPARGVAPAHRHQMLLNVHGGSFTLGGGGGGGEVEAIPIAAMSGITVIAVDYRLAPEHRFPAASEDVEAVYRTLLKRYRARNIGLYGCSAGGIIVGETIARFQSRHLPRPGAIGTFCASIANLGGDSDFTAPALLGLPIPGAVPPITQASNGYLNAENPDDPLVRPSASKAVLAAFPPTLLITGSRDFAMSNVIQSQRLLTEAGVEAELHVWDGMWHGFFMDPDLPESTEAYRMIARFFQRHLR